MPRPDRHAPKDGQSELFQLGTTAATPANARHSLAFMRAITAATDHGLLEDVDEAIASVALAGAWSLDQFEAQNKPYGPSKIVGELREVLASMGMTPEARNSATEANIGDLVDRLAAMDEDEHGDAAAPHSS